MESDNIQEIIVSIVSGGRNNCILTDNQRVKCWGANSSGELGLGNKIHHGSIESTMGMHLPYLNLGSSDSPKHLSLGTAFSCALFDSSKLKCWGSNLFDQLPFTERSTLGCKSYDMGDRLPFINFGRNNLVDKFEAGAYHVCVLFQSNNVFCFGRNNYGQLGQETAIDDIGQYPKIGNQLSFIKFGNNLFVDFIFSGHASNHNCVLFKNAKIKCWGLNDFGQLGLGDINNRGDEVNEMGDSLPFVILGFKDVPKTISLGAFHTCVLLVDSNIKCWGRNHQGQLGIGNAENVGDQPNEMGEKLKQMMLGKGKKGISLGLGMNHSCILLNSGSIKCFGNNILGQLGYGDTDNRGYLTSQIGDSLPVVDLGTDLPITSISSGRFHNCVVFEKKYVKCFGDNEKGQLGYEDTEPRGKQRNQMGQNLDFVNLFSEISKTMNPSSNTEAITPHPTIQRDIVITNSPSTSNQIKNTESLSIDTIIIICSLILALLCTLATCYIFRSFKKPKPGLLIIFDDSDEEVLSAAKVMKRILPPLLLKEFDIDIPVYFYPRAVPKEIVRHVKNSRLVLTILSKRFFSKGKCLLALNSAFEQNIPITGVQLISKVSDSDKNGFSVSIEYTKSDKVTINGSMYLLEQGISIPSLDDNFKNNIFSIKIYSFNSKESENVQIAEARSLINSFRKNENVEEKNQEKEKIDRDSNYGKEEVKYEISII